VSPSVVNAVSNACVAPPFATGYTYNANLGGGGAWVADIGVLVTGANTLPAACLTVGDACWVSSVQNGTIKFVNTGDVMTGSIHSARATVKAYYLTATGYYVLMPIFADDGTSATLQSVITGGSTSQLSEAKGATNGVLVNQPGYGCFLSQWNASPSNSWGYVSVNCPV
jgi:hypothetical protein